MVTTCEDRLGGTMDLSSNQGSSIMQPETRSESSYRQLVEGIRGYAILLLDLKGCIEIWPSAATRLTGYSPDEMLGQPISMLYEPGSQVESQHATALEAAAKRGKCDLDITCTKKGGEVFWADLEIASLYNEHGVLTGFSAVMRDINEREYAHQQRARELAESDRTKGEFLGTIAHELRTPLNSILGWAQLLRRGKLDEASWTRATEIIEASAKAQARLIEALLDTSRIIAGKTQLELRPIRLLDVINAALETIRPAADEKSVNLELLNDAVDPTVSGDSSRLQQVIWSILSNAVKFTPAGGSVKVRLESRNFQIEIAIQDSGCGINAEFLPHIFDAFRQTDGNGAKIRQGLGLGLATVRRLVELHGGTVRAESGGLGAVTTVFVMLPVLTQAGGEACRELTTVPSSVLFKSLKDLRVVVVDDDRSARELTSTILARYGVQVSIASSAREALLAVQQFRPHVLLSDIEMPEEDGYTLISQVRALTPDLGGNTPAVALTAHSRPEERRRTLRAGFQIHLTKPIESDELASAIAHLVDQSETGYNHV